LPYKYYQDTYYPHMGFGPRVYDPAVRPQTNILQKQLMYDEWLIPFVLKHQPDNWIQTWLTSRVPESFITCVPAGVLLVLVPVGLLGLTDRRRCVMAAVLPGYFFIYALLTVFISQYCCLAIGGITLLIMLGARRVESAFPLNGITRVFVPCGIVVATIFALPEVTYWIIDDRGHDMTVIEKDRELPKLIETPAVVMYKFSKGQSVHEEPVYNVDVAWPDDAPIVRVHDLGEARNPELYNYFAKHQPDRVIYRIDRADPTLTPIRLGTARELAGRK
jgi:hypothetical protein